MSFLLSLKEILKKPFVHYSVKIIKTSQFILAESETNSTHFELFFSGFIIQTCMNLLGSRNVIMNAMFLVSTVLKHLSLSPGLSFFHYTIQKEAKDPHASSKIYSHNNKKKQAENKNKKPKQLDHFYSILYTSI